MKKSNAKSKILAMTMLVGIGLSAVAGCTSAEEAKKTDPTVQPTSNVLAALEVTGKIDLKEEEGTVDQKGSVGEVVEYSFVVTSKAKTTLKEVGISTTKGEMWCKDKSGKEGKLLDLAPGESLSCSTAGLPEGAAKDESVAQPHKITAEDVTAKLFEVIAKGHGKNPEAKKDNEKIVVAEPISLKVVTG